MNKRYPPDKWVNKHFTPTNVLIGVGLCLVWLYISCRFIPTNLAITINTSILAVLLVLSLVNLIASVYWRIKYPITHERCKECDQLLPIKYDE